MSIPLLAGAYGQTYYKNDPLRTPEWRIAPGEVRACTYTQTETFKASAYYDEFVRPQGWSSLVVTGLARTPDSFALLALTRSPHALWMEAAQAHLLETLAPHLQRAAAVHSLLAQTRATANALAAATGFAVFLLSASCRILFANPKAEELLCRRMGLLCANGRLAAASPALTHRLQALARAGARPGRGEGEIAGTFELRRGENYPPLVVHVVPVAADRATSVFANERPAAAVIVVDPAAGLAAQIERFAAQFGLTFAETRVLGELIGGTGILAAAAKLNSSESTVRTHANRILAKTGTVRQTELIRRFFETALPVVSGA
jgi:DNA-binding CsgD family transcriptional regulator